MKPAKIIIEEKKDDVKEKIAFLFTIFLDFEAAFFLVRDTPLIFFLNKLLKKCYLIFFLSCRGW